MEKRNYEVKFKDGGGTIVELSQEAFGHINWATFGIKPALDTRFVCTTDCTNCELENFCGNHHLSDIIDIKPFSEPTKNYTFKTKNGHTFNFDMTKKQRKMFHFSDEFCQYDCSDNGECTGCMFNEIDGNCIGVRGFSTNQIASIYLSEGTTDAVKIGIDHDIAIKHLEKDEVFRKYAGFNREDVKRIPMTPFPKVQQAGRFHREPIKVLVDTRVFTDDLEEKPKHDCEIIFKGVQFRCVEYVNLFSEKLEELEELVGVRQTLITIEEPYICETMNFDNIVDGPVKEILKELK